MIAYQPKVKMLIEEMEIAFPDFEVKYKDESTFMKILGKLMFFNKSFMTSYTTTIGNKVYFPSREYMSRNWLNTFYILAHECVHVNNYNNAPVSFVVGYLFPQCVAVLALFSVLAVINPAFLIFLAFLAALAPWPAPFRVKEETDGYSMHCKIDEWLMGTVSNARVDSMASNVCGWGYYNPMYPKQLMIDELKEYEGKEDLPWIYGSIKKVLLLDENL